MRFSKSIIFAQKSFQALAYKTLRKIYSKSSLAERTAPLLQGQQYDWSRLNLNADIFAKEENNFCLNMYCAHRFDLLGTGWIGPVYPQVPVIGFEQKKYPKAAMGGPATRNTLLLLLTSKDREQSRRCLDLITEEVRPYEYIDWQQDYRTGYRWSNRESPISVIKSIGKIPGVDIKIPWELGRLQHLPFLAVAALKLPGRRKELLAEIYNQILDFMAMNPCGRGVHWTNPMECAIRAVNILLAYDIMRSSDFREKEFHRIFHEILSQYIYDHGKYIANHLEWSPWRGNHYLSDIVGLLYISCFLEKNSETNAWFQFSLEEFICECKRQFYPDGGNFESALYYHRFSGELVMWAAALLRGLKDSQLQRLQNKNISDMDKYVFSLKKYKKSSYKVTDNALVLPSWFGERIYRIGKFLADIQKPDGTVPQIGDNDSGRLISLSKIGRMITNKEAEKQYLNLRGYGDLVKERYGEVQEAGYFDSNELAVKPFVSLFYGLFNNQDSENEDEDMSCPEGEILRVVARGRTLTAEKANTIVQPRTRESSKQKFCEQHITTIYASDKNINLTQDIKMHAYPDSGIYVFRSARVYVCLYGVPNGQEGKGGHAHNDKLSLEIMLKDQELFVDPGTYVYTPSVSWRNIFRSTQSHNVPFVNKKEQNRIVSGLKGAFLLIEDSVCSLSDLGNSFCEMAVSYSGNQFVRRVEILPDRIYITDKATSVFKINWFPEFISRGYGKMERYVKPDISIEEQEI